MIYKLLNQEISINSANTVYNAGLVRVVNIDTAYHTVVLASNGVTYASMSLPPNTDGVIEKRSATDTVQATACYASPVAYTN
jgi:hypothetical protein